MQKGLDDDDDDMDFQDTKSSATTCSYKPPDMQYMHGKETKNAF